jgi:transposase InsO family protein
VPIGCGFLYLVAIIDWARRAVLAWRISNTMDTSFCLAALEDALARHGRPEIFNTDQGSQFTSAAFTGMLAAAGIKISMDGRGRWRDNVFIERLWRSLKHEDIYLKGYADGREAKAGIAAWMNFTTNNAFTRRWATARRWRSGAKKCRSQGCGRDGQRCRVDHMPTATAADEALDGVIEKNQERHVSN